MAGMVLITDKNLSFITDEKAEIR